MLCSLQWSCESGKKELSKQKKTECVCVCGAFTVNLKTNRKNLNISKRWSLGFFFRPKDKKQSFLHTLHSGTAKKGVRFIESEKYTNGPKIFRANANIDNDLYEAPKIWIYEFCINRQKGWKKLHNIRIFFWKKYTTTIWKQKGSLDFEIKSRFLFEKKGFSIEKKWFSIVIMESSCWKWEVLSVECSLQWFVMVGNTVDTFGEIMQFVEKCMENFCFSEQNKKRQLIISINDLFWLK